MTGDKDEAARILREVVRIADEVAALVTERDGVAVVEPDLRQFARAVGEFVALRDSAERWLGTNTKEDPHGTT